MDIRSFFGASSSKSTPTIDDRDTDVESEDSDSEVLGPSPAKKCCTSSKQSCDKSYPLSSKRRYNKKWGNNFVGLSTMKIIKELFARYARSVGRHFRELEEPGLPTKQLNNWKKALEKMRAHSQSDVHIQACAADLAVATTLSNKFRMYRSNRG